MGARTCDRRAARSSEAPLATAGQLRASQTVRTDRVPFSMDAQLHACACTCAAEQHTSTHNYRCRRNAGLRAAMPGRLGAPSARVSEFPGENCGVLAQGRRTNPATHLHACGARTRPEAAPRRRGSWWFTWRWPPRRQEWRCCRWNSHGAHAPARAAAVWGYTSAAFAHSHWKYNEVCLNSPARRLAHRKLIEV